jgi:alpha/beta superfamily hydrolase
MAREERRLIDGPAGRIELAIDAPGPYQRLNGLAIVGHPHPLHGGTLDNKVAATMARAFASLGFFAVRFNFRGVGSSEGIHDEGIGETDDLLHIIKVVSSLDEYRGNLGADHRLVLAGFSFGSFVVARSALVLGNPPPTLVLVGAAAGKWPMPGVPSGTLVIHGEFDETIPLSDVLDWARPQDLPVVVIPGADHFFHRRLSVLKALIRSHFVGMSSIDATVQSL